MKIEWRKQDKKLYLPRQKPELIMVPEFKFCSIMGQVNPNSDLFKEYIGVLYSISYGVRMSYKSNSPPAGYYNYTVYPLEGVWGIADLAKYQEGIIDKNNLSFELMIRQPDFATPEYLVQLITDIQKKKPHVLLDSVEFKTIEEGKCVQMLHLGSYDNEPVSFKIMKQFCIDNGLERVSMKHREIYLNDPRKTMPDKLKTVLRFKVK